MWDAEEEILGFADVQLGAGLTLHWNFPELVEAVLRQRLDVAALPNRNSLPAFVIRARLYARSRGITEGVDPAREGPPPDEWLIPPISGSLNRVGGLSGIEERVRAFVDATLGAR